MLLGLLKLTRKSPIQLLLFSATCKAYTKKLNNEFPQLIALLPDENAFRCGLIQTILAEQSIEIDTEKAQQAQSYFDSARMGAFDFFPGVKRC